MPTLTTLDRRLSALEQETDSERRLPWFLDYFNALATEEEIEAEADWIIPMLLRSFILGGTPGYPKHDGSGGLAEHPEIAPLWSAWHAAYHRVAQFVFNATWKVREHKGDMRAIAAEHPYPTPGDLYDFWTRREDESQEQLRLQLVERLRRLLPAPVGLFLADWRPTGPAACTTYPSANYFRWQDEQRSAERKTKVK